MSKIIVLGDLNLDIILSGLQDLPSFGREILSRNCVLKPGGSAANVALMLALNECPVRLFAQVGKDMAGELLLKKLGEYGIDRSTVSQSPKEATGLTVALTFPEDRMYITYPGTVVRTRLEQLDDRYIEPGAHIHLTSYFLQASLRRDVGPILRNARETGMSTSLDPGGDTEGTWDITGLRKVLEFVDYFMPNSDEIKAMSGREELRSAIEEFPGEAEAIIVKAGSHGALTRIHGKIEEHTALKVRVVDTTCAGDSFDAGFLYGISRGETFQQAVRRGIEFGAQAVSTLGLPKEKIESFLSSHVSEEGPYAID